MVGLMLCFSAIFLKLPTLLAVLEDISVVKNISFRVLFAEVMQSLSIGFTQHMLYQLLPVFPRPFLSVWIAYAVAADERITNADLHDIPRGKTRPSSLFYWVTSVASAGYNLFLGRRGGVLPVDFSIRTGCFG